MTNFAFVMELLEISPKKFLEIGFDHTLVSRWRSGKRRLMPERHQVKTIAKMVWEIDSKMALPVLEKLLHIWYPAISCHNETEKQALLEKFLTEKRQTTPEYQKIRGIRLDCLRDHVEALPHGIEAVRFRLLDFLDLVEALAEPEHLYFVFTEGFFLYLNDSNFGKLFTEKLLKLFQAGHRMTSVIRSDRAVTDAWYFHRIRLYAHLKGYMRTRYYDHFQQQGAEKMFGTAGNKIAFTVSRDKLLDLDSTRIDIYNDPQSVADIGESIQGFFDRSRPLTHYSFFTKPAGWLGNVIINNDSPCYLYTRLPHFGLIAPDDYAKFFALNEDEAALLRQEFHALTLTPEFFNESVTIHHIFCATDIENALAKKRHQSLELSTMLGRKVWMSTSNLISQLQKIQTLMKTHTNYEVCFLENEQFSKLLIEVGVWGNEAAIGWIDKGEAFVGKAYPVVAGMQGFCARVWNEIPAVLRSQTTVNNEINQWLKKYGNEANLGIKLPKLLTGGLLRKTSG
jgi:hypothetical protein